MNRIVNVLLAPLLLCLVLLSAFACGGHPEAAASGEAPAQPVYAVETLQKSGDAANRINLVLLGDGYRSQDQAKLTRDAEAWLATFRKTAPYGNYAGYFNVKLIHVVSNEDGADNGMHGLGVARDTALGAAFQNASPAGQPPDFRLLVVDNAWAQAVAMAHAPEASGVLVIVNDSNYGGSGGAVPVFSVNPQSGLIALHEMGHGFGGLADEYACGETSALPATVEAYPNVTTLQLLDQIKWKGWIEPGTPLPTPDTGTHTGHLGLFEGAYYRNGGIYRPRHDCRMRSLNEGFCEVCSEALVRGVYGRVRPIDAAFPASPVVLEAGATATLSLTHPVPSPNTLQVRWTVDGVTVPGSGDRLDLQAQDLKPGTHEVQAQLVDATALVRQGREALAQVHRWTVNVGGAAAPLPPQAPAVPRQHLLLRVIQDGAGFRVAARRVIDLPLPAQPAPAGGDWQVEVLGPEGQVLHRQGLEDPSQIRGEFQNPSDPRRIDGYRLSGTRPPSFLLRVPLQEAHRLEVFQGPDRTRLGGVDLRTDPAP